MEPAFSNECRTHKAENNCFCKDCGSIMCTDCSKTHKCPTMKKKVIEYLHDSLISNFKFMKYIGKGSFGSVFQVKSYLDDQIYALKVIEDVDKASFQQVKKEIAIMAKIKHPNIVRYCASNWLLDKEVLWISMELCDGSLDKHLKNLDQKTALQYFKHICEGIRVLHKEYKIIHRDLKPGNILIKDNIAKLCDFGQSKEFKENLSLSNNLGFGTYEYLAPEIFDLMENKENKYNEKTDIWALGIILHKMLNKNEHPFLLGVKMTEENKIDTIKRILNQNQPIIHPSIDDPNIIKILNGCLETSPKKRMDIQEILGILEESKNNIINDKEMKENGHFEQEKLSKVENWKLLRTLEGHSVNVYSVCISKDGSKIASGSWDKTIKIWDISSGKILKTLEGHSDNIYCVCFSNDGNKIASGSKDNTIKIWDVSSFTLLKSLEFKFNVYSVCFSSNGCYIASGLGNSKVELWDVATGNFLMELLGHSQPVNSVCFSLDGTMIVSGSSDTTVKLWDFLTKKLMKTFVGHSHWVNSVCFSSDCSKIISGSRDATVKLWEVSTRNLLKTMGGHLNWVNSVCFSPDELIIVSGSDDHTIKLWDVLTGKLLGTLEGHAIGVRSVCFSDDGSLIISGSRDKSIKIWGTSKNSMEIIV